MIKDIKPYLRSLPEATMKSDSNPTYSAVLISIEAVDDSEACLFNGLILIFFREFVDSINYYLGLSNQGY